jgi:DNA-directed RNA polymerase specialized sigma24 family protein
MNHTKGYRVRKDGRICLRYKTSPEAESAVQIKKDSNGVEEVYHTPSTDVSAEDQYWDNLPDEPKKYTANRDALLTELDQLRSKLYKKTLAAAAGLLTQRQYAIFAMYLDGKYSQKEIAEKLGIKHQSNVNHSLHGTRTTNSTSGSFGSICKLKQWAWSDSDSIAITKRIKEIQGELNDEENS